MEILATAIDILAIVFLALLIVGGIWGGVPDKNPPGINELDSIGAG